MSKNEKNVSVRGLSHVFKNFCTWLNSQLSPVAKSGDYNDLINKPVLPQINVDASDGSWVISRDTDGNFFRMVHTGWSRSGSNSWAGMYFQTSDKTDVFAFAARQSTSPLEKFTVGNNGYIRGYDTNGNRSVTLTINGGTAGKPDTQNITVDGTFVNAGNQRPFSKNNYTIGTSDMPYEAMYAGTFNTNTTSDSGLIASNSSTNHSLLFGVSSSGVSRGIYDNKNSRWSVFLDDTDYIKTQCPTPPAGDSSNKLATTEWVQNETSSAIRAQWYAAYPDGAEAHNAMWGGRNITTAFNNGTFSANVANGTFKDIFPGDYITKQVTISGTTYTVNWVIADCDYWINKGDNPVTTAHHVAIVPQAPIFNANMNATNTAEGGYAGSRMYKETIQACATGIVSAFGSSHILTFQDRLTRDLNISAVSSGITVFAGAPNWSGAWYSQQCNLMSEAMVYDGPHCASSAVDNIMAARQMSAFRLSEKLINYNRQWWWLRDVVSSAFFAYVSGNGHANTHNASHVLGVRPFALLR